ncbi:NAD(P)H-quinone oxidoreductase [Corynebacterium renale]|uniref:Putative PIG3 family NAD(P)H quinone oxidoreductase n=1 Tax=Corynebacterium renale TaxID=1724 RepID=A0A2A9DNP3_9CORY|nr:NAD(P)H-quinone oxidoreductase [Corynebacterium renale]PFG27529.1 putative PIG3 family NAD(P)H quinone oxidoreductase [Corynebacterium renale]SQI23156.1 quinone oxidoreductase [Corynebacterium renale]
MLAYEVVNKELVRTERPRPEPKSGEVLVEVAGVGVNRGDVLQVAGHYPPPPGVTDIPGLECSGTILDAGDTNMEVGQKVSCLLAGGAYAEYVAVPAGQVAPIPEPLTTIEGGSIIEVAATVWSNLGMVAGLREGHRVLIHGGAGGIGSFAIQLCAALGAEVAVTAGSQEKLDYCASLGATTLINYKEEDFAERLKGSCDIILDIMGAKYLAGNIRSLADDGQLVIIGLQGGTRAEINLGALLPKRLSIHGRTLRARSLEDKAEIVRSTVENVWPLLAEGKIVHHSRTLPFEEAARAHELLTSGENTGKLVLEV